MKSISGSALTFLGLIALPLFGSPTPPQARIRRTFTSCSRSPFKRSQPWPDLLANPSRKGITGRIRITEASSLKLPMLRISVGAYQHSWSQELFNPFRSAEVPGTLGEISLLPPSPGVRPWTSVLQFNAFRALGPTVRLPTFLMTAPLERVLNPRDPYRFTAILPARHLTNLLGMLGKPEGLSLFLSVSISLGPENKAPSFQLSLTSRSNPIPLLPLSRSLPPDRPEAHLMQQRIGQRGAPTSRSLPQEGEEKAREMELKPLTALEEGEKEGSKQQQQIAPPTQPAALQTEENLYRGTSDGKQADLGTPGLLPKLNRAILLKKATETDKGVEGSLRAASDGKELPSQPWAPATAETTLLPWSPQRRQHTAAFGPVNQYAYFSLNKVQEVAAIQKIFQLLLWKHQRRQAAPAFGPIKGYAYFPLERQGGADSIIHPVFQTPQPLENFKPVQPFGSGVSFTPPLNAQALPPAITYPLSEGTRPASLKSLLPPPSVDPKAPLESLLDPPSNASKLLLSPPIQKLIPQQKEPPKLIPNPGSIMGFKDSFQPLVDPPSHSPKTLPSRPNPKLVPLKMPPKLIPMPEPIPDPGTSFENMINHSSDEGTAFLRLPGEAFPQVNTPFWAPGPTEFDPYGVLPFMAWDLGAYASYLPGLEPTISFPPPLQIPDPLQWNPFFLPLLPH